MKECDEFDDHDSDTTYVPLQTAEEKEIDDLDFDNVEISSKPADFRTRRAKFLKHVKDGFGHLHLDALLPSFLQPRASQPKTLHASAWLGKTISSRFSAVCAMDS